MHKRAELRTVHTIHNTDCIGQLSLCTCLNNNEINVNASAEMLSLG